MGSWKYMNIYLSFKTRSANPIFDVWPKKSLRSAAAATAVAPAVAADVAVAATAAVAAAAAADVAVAAA